MTRMSVDQKQNVMTRNAEEERALLEKTIQEARDEKKADSSSSEDASSDSETGAAPARVHSPLSRSHCLFLIGRCCRPFRSVQMQVKCRWKVIVILAVGVARRAE